MDMVYLKNILFASPPLVKCRLKCSIFCSKQLKTLLLSLILKHNKIYFEVNAIMNKVLHIIYIDLNIQRYNNVLEIQNIK